MKDKTKTIQRLTTIKNRIDKELSEVESASSPGFLEWKTDAEAAVRLAFGEGSPEHRNFKQVNYGPPITLGEGWSASGELDALHRGLDTARALLSSSSPEPA